MSEQQLDVLIEPVEDIPVLIAHEGSEVDRQYFMPHGNWRGRHVGQVVLIWLTYSLTTGDHRLSHRLNPSFEHCSAGADLVGIRCPGEPGQDWAKTGWGLRRQPQARNSHPKSGNHSSRLQEHLPDHHPGYRPNLPTNYTTERSPKTNPGSL